MSATNWKHAVNAINENAKRKILEELERWQNKLTDSDTPQHSRAHITKKLRRLEGELLAIDNQLATL